MSNNITFNDILALVSEEDKAISSYMHQAEMYILSNHDEIKKSYTKFIFNELKINEPKNSNNLNSYWHIGLQTIYYFVDIHSSVLVLYHPTTKEPSILDSAFDFSGYNIAGFEEQILSEYANKMKIESNENSTNPFIGVAINRSTKLGAGVTLEKIGSNLMKTASILENRANFYGSVHKYMTKNRRILKYSFSRDKTLNQVLRKIDKFGVAAARTNKLSFLAKFGGSKLIKSALKGPVTLGDLLFTPGTLHAPNPINIIEQDYKLHVINKLSEYCTKNYNYSFIINEKSINQN